MLNIDDPKVIDRTPALLRLAFRPFFLLAAVWACIAIPLWLLAWYHPEFSPFAQKFWSNVVPLWWHPHEMLFGFAMAVVAGFLLTASQNWTNQPGIKGGQLGLVVGLWAMARLTLMLPWDLPIWLPASFDCAFLLAVAVKLTVVMLKVRQWRNMVFPVLLFVAAAINLLSYWTLANHNLSLSLQIWQAMIWWLALIITVMGGRVIPFFTAARLKLTKREPITWIEWTTPSLLALMLVNSLVPFLPYVAKVIVLTVAGVLQLVRLARWYPLKTVKIPLLWSLHLGYLFLPISLLAMAYYANNPLLERQLLHLFAIGTMAGVCLSMISRVSLGHTGRNIYQGPNMAPAFLMLAVAAIVRTILPLEQPADSYTWHWLAAALWCGAFGMFVWHYTKILARPRLDGRPG
ncbi:NnrS family protein [Ferrimonas lipolytica]|uniref:NnrS family protein n=1 Tax=Ferrimonas lipolytica TaxID=2724191 RepID=A0A6H1UH40_9GAMM|nr:NnrS family protein [Ferrimonas lipolytica]QIZ78425.1 NnrS family protein [Ferrimonas lipolytica]